MSRYIDAEKLKAANRKHFPSLSLRCELNYIINEIPTANVRENVHGEWKTEEDYDGDILYTCSVCGEPWCTIEGTPSDNHMNYCPNCGALMSESLKWAEIGKAFAEGLNEGLNCDAERSEE